MIGPHGHVLPRPDGQKARCGGPLFCPQCAAELSALPQWARPEPYTVTGKIAALDYPPGTITAHRYGPGTSGTPLHQARVWHEHCRQLVELIGGLVWRLETGGPLTDAETEHLILNGTAMVEHYRAMLAGRISPEP